MGGRGQPSESLKRKSFRKSQKAFSIIEAFITLIVVGLALGASAPLITTQIKKGQFNDIQVSQILKRLEKLENGVETPQDAVMFFKSTTCPEGWAKISGFGGYYLRIQNTGETIGSTKEQMVHKHKHVSPFTSYSRVWNDDKVNTRRYGPYKSANTGVIGDLDYPAAPSANSANGPFNLTAGGFFNQYGDEWISYTSDGLNRIETLMNGSYSLFEVLTCPNRDEGDNICKPNGNALNTPYLSEMPLVGNENRPNSIVLTACVKGYESCSMSDGSLICN